MSTVLLRFHTYAKINLTLDIVGRRTDGYHELASVVQTVSLADDLDLTMALGRRADDVRCKVEGMALAPADNLVVRAATMLRAVAAEPRGAELSLTKRIPAAAGLGGGSSDAATTLVGLNELWGLGLDLTTLAGLAEQLGSDVPFFLRGGAALMRGRGSDLEPLPALPDQWLVLVVPEHDLADKTRRLYGALQPGDFSSGEVSQALAQRLRHGHVTVEDAALGNGFSRAAREVFGGLAGLWTNLEALAGRPFHLSGAGPALFTLARSDGEARSLAQALQEPGRAVFALHTTDRARTRS